MSTPSVEASKAEPSSASDSLGEFASINPAYGRVFGLGRLTLGLVVPIEAYPTRVVPALDRHIERVCLAEALGFSAVWLRDVPLVVPAFGDAGQVFDPFVYLGALTSATKTIALGVASIVLPLRHPAHVAKAAASVDVLSGGRLLLGVASGDRPEEYPALGVSFDDRGARFRESLSYIGAAAQAYPYCESTLGTLSGRADLLPKPVGPRIPLLITGGSQQTPRWVAEHGDGWMTYPRELAPQRRVVADYRRRLSEAGMPNKPVMQSLYIDLVDDPNGGPRPIHLGFQSGVSYLRHHLRALQSIGVNHVALNLRFNTADVETTMERRADGLLPEFSR